VPELILTDLWTGTSYIRKRWPVSLFTFPSLMSRLGQKLAMFVLSHLFSAFFNNTAQLITSFFLKMEFLAPLKSITGFFNTPHRHVSTFF
jgi:hypothetical protein